MGVITNLLSTYANTKAEEQKQRLQQQTQLADLMKTIIQDPNARPEKRAQAQGVLVDMVTKYGGKQGREMAPQLASTFSTFNALQSLAGQNQANKTPTDRTPVPWDPQQAQQLAQAPSQQPQPQHKSFGSRLRQLAGGVGEAFGLPETQQPYQLPEGLRGSYEMSTAEQDAERMRRAGLAGEEKAATQRSEVQQIIRMYNDPAFRAELKKGHLSDDEITAMMRDDIQKASGVTPRGTRTRQLGGYIQGDDPMLAGMSTQPGELYKVVVDEETGKPVSVFKAGNFNQMVNSQGRTLIWSYMQQGMTREQANLRAAEDITASFDLTQQNRALTMKINAELAGLQLTGAPPAATPTPTSPATPAATTPPAAPAATPPPAVQQPGGGATTIAPPQQATPAPQQPAPTPAQQTTPAPQPTPPPKQQPGMITVHGAPQGGWGQWESKPLTQQKPGGGQELTETGKNAVLGLTMALTPGLTGMRGTGAATLGREEAMKAVATIAQVPLEQVPIDAGKYRALQQGVQQNQLYEANLERALGQIDQFGKLLADSAKALGMKGAPILNKPWMEIMRQTSAGNKLLEDYRVSLNAMQRAYTILTASALQSRGMPPVTTQTHMQEILDENLSVKRMLEAIAQIKKEGVVDRAGVRSAVGINETDLRQNSISVALAGGRPSGAPAAGNGALPPGAKYVFQNGKLTKVQQ